MKLVVGNLEVRVDAATEQERTWLRTFLTFGDSGSWFRRRGGGDGRMHLFHEFRGTFPAGLLDTVVGGFAAEGGQAEVVDQRIRPCEPDPNADLGWLRDYQREAVDAAVRRTRGILRCPTGSGKTEQAIGIVRVLPCRWMFLVHRSSLLEQTAERYEKRTGERAGKVGDGVWGTEGARFVAATFQTLHAALRSEGPDRKRALALLDSVEGLIVDECFVAGTLVGNRRIEDLRVGDVVDAYDEPSGRRVRRSVTRIFSRRPSALIRLALDDGRTVVCTPDHPFLTTVGWRPARALLDRFIVEWPHEVSNSSAALRNLRSPRSENGNGTGSEDLLRSLPHDTEVGAASRNDGALRGMRSRDRSLGARESRESAAAEDVLRHLVPVYGVVAPLNDDGESGRGTNRNTDARAEPVAPSRRESESQCDAPPHRTSASLDWGQGSRIDGAADGTVGGADGCRRRLGRGVSSDDGSRKRPAELHLPRRRESDETCSGGSRRNVALPPEDARRRRAQDGVPSCARVARVEVLEPGLDGRFGGRCSDGLVYNLEVADAHTYLVAGGLVAHNCHVLPAGSFWRLAQRTRRAYYRIGMSVGGEARIFARVNGKQRYEAIHDIAALVGRIGPGTTRPTDLWIRSRGVDGFRWSRVREVIAHRPDARRLFRIRTAYSREILVTEDHAVYRVEPGRAASELGGPGAGRGSGRKRITAGLRVRREPLLVCVRGDSVRPGDFLLLDAAVDLEPEASRHLDLLRLASRSGRRRGYVTRSDGRFSPFGGKQSQWSAPMISRRDLAFFIGFFLGDGWIGGNRANLAVERDLLPSLLLRIDPFLRALGTHASIRRMPRGSDEVRIGSAVLVDVLRVLGCDRPAEEKRLPAIAWQGFDAGDRADLLEGLCWSDGHLAEASRRRRRFYYSTVSRNLAEDIVGLLATLGRVGSITTSPPRLGGVIAGHRVSGRFGRHVVHWSAHERRGRAGSGRHPVRFLPLPGGGLPVEVRSVEEVQVAPPLVYDFVVDGAANFTANGLLVHNSGTPLDRTDRRSILAVAALGPIIYSIPAQKLVESGVLARPEIRVSAVHHLTRAATWPEAYRECIVDSGARNDQVVKAVKHAEKPALVFVGKIDHGRRLVRLLEHARINCEFVWGATGTDFRGASVRRLVRGDVDVIVCSVVFQEGLDIPSLRSVIVATGGKSIIAALQRIGRGMRTTNDKRTFQVWDFNDRGNKWLEKHSRQRLRAYKREGYEIASVDLTTPQATLPGLTAGACRGRTRAVEHRTQGGARRRNEWGSRPPGTR